MSQVIQCKCGEVIMKALDSDVKVRAAKVIVFREEGAFVVCKGCDAEVRVPLQLDQPLLKSMIVGLKTQPLYVNLGRKSS